jgi:hypothetical protein
MNHRTVSLRLFMAIALNLIPTIALSQETRMNSLATSAVPRIVTYSGSLLDLDGRPLAGGTVGVTFSLYRNSQAGAPLWIETQNVTAMNDGHYSVDLGSTTNQGLPQDLFISGEARWLGIQIAGQEPLPRVLLVAVPYALKAGDAQTVGGLPPSAFVLAQRPAVNDAASAIDGDSSVSSALPPASSDVTTNGGILHAIPLWTSATNIQSSVITETGSGATAKIGINSAVPAATLDITGTETVRGVLTLPGKGTATSAKGFSSQPLSLVASAFDSSRASAINAYFNWQAEAAGNNSVVPSASLNLLFGSAGSLPTETGLKIAKNGLITFAAGQAFPGTGSGTVKSVGLSAPSSDFTVSGSPVTSSGTMGLNWNTAPTSANTANAIVKRDGSGNFSAGMITASNLDITSLAATGLIYSSTSNDVAVEALTSSPSGVAIYGASDSITGDGKGVFGETGSGAAASYGVMGYAYSDTGSPVGVYGNAGKSPDGIGVFGQNGGESIAGLDLDGYLSTGGAGIWGDGGFDNPGGMGVVGTVDDGTSGVFLNNTTDYYTLFTENATNGGFSFGAYNGVTNSFCNIDAGGDLSCSGTKNAIVPIDGGKRTVALSAIESPKSWFEDFGSMQLVHGATEVVLDSDFAQTVTATQEYEVFLTPYGDCKGLYVSNRTPNSFEVHELGGGDSSVSFGYRITALRRNYEKVRFADHTHDLDALKRMHEQAKKAAAQPRSHDPKNKPGILPAKSARENAGGLITAR